MASKPAQDLLANGCRRYSCDAGQELKKGGKERGVVPSSSWGGAGSD